MTADDLREMIAYFEVPAEETLVSAGLHADGVRQLLAAAGKSPKSDKKGPFGRGC